ncbi:MULTISPECIES: DUF488 domain-containing protein [unclassified Paenibacillus]|uniref:DUF488 domain-containing protein n=1 Tax=unclassified Paenibacillus TaxID=185978 RepID=UPI0005A745D1|nr:MULTISPECIES: DUF488 family protein [unclassified Paenibacillus]OMF33071.1 hypothetical protein BK132_02245 [Paenibacillus sp. FSL H8-0259]
MLEHSCRRSADLPYSIYLKRVYEPAAPGDGYRILVDRLWPRGITKQQAAIDEWMKELAPSPGLRQWFGHIPERFAAFSNSYIRELEEDPARGRLAAEIAELALAQDVTLIYAAKDPIHNHAQVLYKWLLSRQ